MINTRNTAANNTEVISVDSDLNRMLETLTEESRSTMKVISKIIETKLETKLSILHNNTAEKDHKIEKLDTEVSGLKTK